MAEYHPTEYWLERGKSYYKEFEHGWDHRQETALLKHLDGLEFASVLEVGCGFGRITNLIADRAQEYHAIDISPDQIDRAKEYVKAPVKFEVNTIQRFPQYRKYNLVLACEVLLHIPPSEIEGVIAKLVKLSNKYVVHIDPTDGDNLESHNFIHDYRGIYDKLGLKTEFIPIEGMGQRIVSSHIR